MYHIVIQWHRNIFKEKVYFLEIVAKLKSSNCGWGNYRVIHIKFSGGMTQQWILQ